MFLIYLTLAVKISFPSNLLPTAVVISVVFFTYKHLSAYRSERRRTTLLPLVLIIGIWYLYCLLSFFPLIKLMISVSVIMIVGMMGSYLFHKYRDERICLLFVLFSLTVPLIFYLPSICGDVPMVRYITACVIGSTPFLNYINYYRFPYGRSKHEDKFLRGDKLSGLKMDTYITGMQYTQTLLLLSCTTFGIFIFEDINIPVSYSKVALHALFCSMMIALYTENFLFVLTYVGFLSTSPKIDTQ